MGKGVIWKPGVAAIIISFLLLGSVSVANAWNVTVRNDTNYTCKIRLYMDRFFTCHLTDYQSIATGSSYQWDTGGWCPLSLEGEINVDGKWIKMKSINIGVGNEINDACQDSSAACWNSSWIICRKRGSGTINDYDYGFCK